MVWSCVVDVGWEFSLNDVYGRVLFSLFSSSTPLVSLPGGIPKVAGKTE